MRLLLQVASLYYEQGLTQEEIAQRVNLSRSNVSRLLSQARHQGVVEIRVRRPVPTVPALESELKTRFGLHDAQVLANGMRSTDLTLRDVGALAAEQIRNHLHDGMILSVGWGRALYETVQAFRPVSVRQVDVVQVMGGLGAVDPYIDGNELARHLAESLGAHLYYLRAPYVVESATICDALMKEPVIRLVMEMARNADLTITGIGSIRPELSGLLRAGYLTEDDLHTIAETGAVGDICGQYIDIHGEVCQLELHRRIITIDLPSLLAMKRVVAVAAWREKAPVILGALRGGFVDVLITDEAAAQEVLHLAETT
jgi:DNA-binding transcriptional regulator LsrR (DeoR family)